MVTNCAPKPLAIDLFCGLGGWTEGLLAEGFDVIGFDIERHEYGGTFGWDGSPMRRGNSRSPGRKMASAMIAKIPLPLSRHIAATFRPQVAEVSR